MRAGETRVSTGCSTLGATVSNSCDLRAREGNTAGLERHRNRGQSVTRTHPGRKIWGSWSGIGPSGSSWQLELRRRMEFRVPDGLELLCQSSTWRWWVKGQNHLAEEAASLTAPEEADGLGTATKALGRPYFLCCLAIIPVSFPLSRHSGYRRCPRRRRSCWRRPYLMSCPCPKEGLLHSGFLPSYARLAQQGEHCRQNSGE